MKINSFYDRKQELQGLKEKYASLTSGEMLVLYGRRRVGKTELVRQFMGTIENCLYFYVDLVEKKGLLDSLSKAILDQLKETITFAEFDDFLKYLEKKGKKFVLIIDEFQRLLETAPEFITRLQHYWDSQLKHKQIMIILVGSSIGMMQRITNSKAGALYGRTTRTKISPFTYHAFREMFQDLTEEEKIILYSVFGGTPYYLEKVKKREGSIHTLIEELVLKKGAELYEEPKTLLEYENVRIHSKYNAILSSIAAGKETLKEMSDFTGIEQNIMPAYIEKMDVLLDLVKKKDPLLGKKRLGRYMIGDNFFRFWYKFIFPNQTSLNLGNTKGVSLLIQKNLNSYVGRVFEEIIRELLVLYLNKKIKNTEIVFDDIGNFWDRSGNEIDIVAIGRNKILLGEVKWTSKPTDTNILEDLMVKAKYIPFKGNYQLFMVSKSGFTEACLKRMNELSVLYLDLTEIEQLFDRP